MGLVINSLNISLKIKYFTLIHLFFFRLFSSVSSISHRLCIVFRSDDGVVVVLIILFSFRLAKATISTWQNREFDRKDTHDFSVRLAFREWHQVLILLVRLTHNSHLYICRHFGVCVFFCLCDDQFIVKLCEREQRTCFVLESLCSPQS